MIFVTHVICYPCCITGSPHVGTSQFLLQMQKPSFTREWSYPFQNPTDVINVRKRNLENSINYFLGLGETGAFLAIFVKVNFRSNYVRI